MEIYNKERIVHNTYKNKLSLYLFEPIRRYKNPREKSLTRALKKLLEKIAFFNRSRRISRKRYEIGQKLPQIAKRKS